MADYNAEKYMKRLIGKKEVEDALGRLDMLTNEENLMTVARNLEVTHRVDVNVKATQELTHRVDDKVTTIEEVVHDVDGNVRATQELTYDVHENVIAIKEDTRSVHDNVKVTRHGGQHSCDFFIHITDPRTSYVETAMNDLQRSLLPGAPFTDCYA